MIQNLHLSEAEDN